ncbi:MAG: hypothetical protein OEL57_09300 [Trichlorobacter sp.]|uniref:hypothetical protein n=1 Tax=Trichlorobacter sp. TaxID=2911007 RepID=UPI0025632E1E|nr:hypothetical protein [Trichlorobacter sp.]MDK9718086.1 hypothetical protein [Trichlorobacter sp.]
MHRSGTPSYPVHSDCAQINGVVAVEPAGSFFRVFTRTAQGVTFHDYPFTPFILLSDSGLADAAPVTVTHHHLAGSGKLCWLTELASWHDWCLLRDYLQTLNRPEEWFAIPDSCLQFLITSGITFFKGLSFSNLNSLDVHVQKDDQSLFVIAVTDGYACHEVIAGKHLTETAKLMRLTQIIRDQDPDIITGYQLNKHVLPQLISYAQQNKVRLEWGRNGSELYQQQPVDYRSSRRYEVYGRSLVDLQQLMNRHDRQMQPTQLPTDESAVLAAAKKAVQRYQQIAPDWCQQVQRYPISFQKLLSSQAVTAVHAQMIRAYLLQQHAVPARSSAPRRIHNHGTDFYQQGQAGPVIHCSLAQLPVAIMVAYRIAPRADELGLFSKLLGELHQDSVCNQTAGPELVVSGWYEILNNAQTLFSDAEAASEVVRLRQVITRDLLDCLKEQGATPVVVDQQGIYFIPVCGQQDGSTEVHVLTQRLDMIIPNKVVLPITGPYRSIFIYKPNQFALLHQDGEIVFSGSSFASRSREPFLREFLVEAVRRLLTGQGQTVEQLNAEFVQRLTGPHCPVTWVMRSETLVDSREQYERAVLNKKRNRAAAYELAIATAGAWRGGDMISYYVTGHSKNCVVHENCRLVKDFDPQQPDLNRLWYLERLHQLFKRLQPFLPVEPLLFK